MTTPLSWRTLLPPLLLTLLWCLLLFALFGWTLGRENAYTEELARSQTETLFSNIVDTREWNARHGGVWVQESDDCPANPWLPEKERTLLTEDGRLLVRVNPAYMTRQIAESTSSPISSFRISSLNPVRPQNRADQWETSALQSFHEGTQNAAFEHVSEDTGHRFRYMSPLKAKASCLHCHTSAKVGDVLGGISVSISAEPLLEASDARKRTTGFAFALIGLIGTVGIGGATFQINRKRELAEAANRTKSAFLANMTHDMRTPLAGMLGMTELLERETCTARHRYLLQNLRAATDSLLDVVDGIMRYSLLEAEGQPRRSAPFSLKTEVAACLAVLRPACEHRGIRMELVRGEDVPEHLRGDGFRLRQALGNLLGNAVKFTSRGSVTLRITVLGKERSHNTTRYRLAFQVIDTGPGIPPQDQERIFESFEQGSALRATDPEKAGVGLGLAIARNIARRFGGDLTLSSSPGQGSVFTLTACFEAVEDFETLHDTTALESPVMEAPADEILTCETPEAPCARRGKELVVAEDTPVTAVFLHETLSRAGYGVHMASCGEDAQYIIRKIRPDAVVLDMRLPDMTGLDIATRIRAGELEIPADTPILVLTATLKPEDETVLHQIGVNAWALKPVQTSRLLETLALLLPTETAVLKTAFRENEQTDTVPVAEPLMGSAVTAVPFSPEAEAMKKDGSEAPSPDTAHQPTKVTMPEAPVFDHASALEDMSGNKALLNRLCALFLRESPGILDALRSESSTPATLRRQAHSLKNGAGTLHLNQLRAACAELEQAQDAAIPPVLARVISALEEATTALRDTGV